LGANGDSDARRTHLKCIHFLESYNYSSQSETWIEMADDLGWEVYEGKLYALQYFIAMQSVKGSEEYTIGPGPNEIILVEAQIAQKSWPR
jgi:hypothetical protein